MTPTKKLRDYSIKAMVSRTRAHLANGVCVNTIELAKQELMSLCSMPELFPRTEFPVPSEVRGERFFLVHEDSDQMFALYVNSALPGQSYPPHNHGNSWAIIAAIEGREYHGLYRQSSEQTVELIEEIIVQPGTAISMLQGGIHSIRAIGQAPLLHLHYYGFSLQSQGQRIQFDINSSTADFLTLGKNELSYIEDMR